MDPSENQAKQKLSSNSNDNDKPPQIPYRRDRTPSIVVQSLGLSFQKDSNITESIELPGDDEDSSPNSSEASDPKSSTSGVDEAPNQQCDSSGASAKGSLSSLPNSSSPGATSPVRAGQKQQFNASRPSPPPLGPGTNRRLSLNTIMSTAPRRQSLTVDGLAAYAGNATGSLRNKVTLKPGHSLMGWIKLASAAKDLAGTGGKIIEVSPEDLAKHDKETDCWVALKGNVYNVTTYLQYHPGGIEELMRGAGRDATELFNEVHRWVNYESILAKCYVGPYKLDSPLTPVGRANFKTITDPPAGTNRPLSIKDPTIAHKPPRRQSIALTVPSPNKYQSLLLNNSSTTNFNQIQQPPTYVIMQDKSCIKLKVQDLTTLPLIRSRNLICDLNQRMELHLSVILSPDWLYRVHLRLDQAVDEKISAELSSDNGTITTQILKKKQEIWNKIGTSLDLNDSLCEMTLADKFFRACKLVSREQLTHDTYLLEFNLEHTLMYVPIGWHVLMREHLPLVANQEVKHNDFDDRRIHKNYTPVLPKLVNNDGMTDEQGFMTSLFFIIKMYPDGVLTSKLNNLKIGDNVDISDYQCVDFNIEELVNGPTKHWFLFAAGTGITPFCRVISNLLSQSSDCVETINLIFFNKTTKDIIWREQFEELQSLHNGRFCVTHVLSEEPLATESSDWSGRRGRVSKELIAEFVDVRSPDELKLFACGPRGFTQLVKSISKELNLHEKLYVFHG